MKNSYIYKVVQLLSFTVLVLSSCIDEKFGGIDNIDLGEEIEVTFQYNVSDMSIPQTRTVIMTEEAMRVVRDIHVLVYKIDQNGEEILDYQRDVFNHTYNGDGTGTFRVRLAKSKENEKYSMDFLINLTSAVRNAENIIKRGEKRETIRQEFYNNSPLAVTATTNLHMWAGIEPMVIQKDTSFPNLNIIRTYARMDVGVNMDSNDNAQGISNFELKYAGTTNTGNRTLYIPDRNNINGANVIAPSFSSAYSGRVGVNGRSNITDDKIIGGIFLAETKGEYIATNNNYFSLVIGGNYKDEDEGSSSMQYYRIVLSDPNNPEKRIDLLRNHKYRVNILSVNGPGYATSALAATGVPSNVTYELTVHEEGDINHIVYNNTGYLGVSTTFLEFDASAFTGNEIKVRSNAGGWSVKTILDENGANINWITFTTPSGTANVTGTAKFNLTQNNGSPRVAYVTFTAGQLEITVRVLQNSAWYISSNYTPPNYMLGDGDKYEVYAWGAVPGLMIRAWTPDHILVVSRDTLTTIGGVVSAGSPITLNLEIVGNAVLPNKVRQVQFQYSEDGGTTWIPFEEGPQGKGHFRLKSSGRIVSLYDYKDTNGNDKFLWAEAMGVDSKWNTQGHLYDPQYPYFYRTFNVPLLNLPFPGLATGNNRNSLYYTPHDGFLTGCADYEEPGYENVYPKGGWRLPSVQELREINLYKEHIGDLAPIGEAYWSSTDQHVTGASMPGSYRIFITPNPDDPVDDEWLDWFIPGPRYSAPSRARCVYGDPVEDVIKEQYSNWYFSPNKDPRND